MRDFARQVSLLRLQVDGRAHLEVRTRRIAFREENMERVFLAFDKPHRIEVHRTLFRIMATADIHHQAVIDKHPNVIVAAELEILPAYILELRRNLHRKTVVVVTAANIVVVLRIPYRMRLVQKLEIVNRVEPRMFRVVTVRRVRNVGQPESLFVERQVDIAANRVRVRGTAGIHPDHLRYKPLFNLVRRRAHLPRVIRRIHARRQSVHQRIAHHPLHEPATSLVRIEPARRIEERHRRIRTPAVNVAEVHVDTVMVRFARPVHHQGRNLHRRANAQTFRVRDIQTRRAVRNRVRENPDRIDQRHQLPKRNQGIDNLTLFDRPHAAVMLHPEGLLEHHVPIVHMLVISPLVPPARIGRNRPHLHRIVGQKHRRRHVVPRRKQPDRLRFRRVIHKILHVHLGARIEPHLVNARGEQVLRQRPFVLRKVRVLRPFVGTAQQLHPGPRRTPLRRRHKRIREVDMVPERVFPRIAQLARGIHDVVVNRHVERRIAETRIVAPRVVNMEPARRVKAFARGPLLESDFHLRRRPVDKDRILDLQGPRQIHGTFCFTGDGKPRGHIAVKIGRLDQIVRHHRRRHRPVKPPAHRSIALGKAHQHRIRPKPHLRKRAVPPRALEPHDFGTRRHERPRVRAARRIRIQPNFRLGTEKRSDFHLAEFRPGYPVIVVVVLVRRIRVKTHRKSHPVLEIGQGLVPGIHKPAVPLAFHHRRGIIAVHRVVAATGPAQNVRNVLRTGRIVAIRGLDMNNKGGMRKHRQKSYQAKHPYPKSHNILFSYNFKKNLLS